MLGTRCAAWRGEAADSGRLSRRGARSWAAGRRTSQLPPGAVASSRRSSACRVVAAVAVGSRWGGCAVCGAQTGSVGGSGGMAVGREVKLVRKCEVQAEGCEWVWMGLALTRTLVQSAMARASRATHARTHRRPGRVIGVNLLSTSLPLQLYQRLSCFSCGGRVEEEIGNLSGNNVEQRETNAHEDKPSTAAAPRPGQGRSRGGRLTASALPSEQAVFQQTSARRTTLA